MTLHVILPKLPLITARSSLLTAQMGSVTALQCILRHCYGATVDVGIANLAVWQGLTYPSLGPRLSSSFSSLTASDEKLDESLGSWMRAWDRG